MDKNNFNIEDNSSDNFSDEFQMKPITAGLGFHKKPVSLKEHIAKSSLYESKVKSSLPAEPPREMFETTPSPRSAKAIIGELHEALKAPSKNSNLQLTDILPKKASDMRAHSPEINRREQPHQSPIENINFQIPKASINESQTRRGAPDNLIAPLTPVPVSFAASALDAITVAALSMIFMATLISVTGVDLISVVTSASTEFATQLSLIVLYLAVYQMYLIIARSFFGRTLGEWTFDLQMGTDEQMVKGVYPALVLWRAVFVLFTGIIFVPLISLIAGKDVAKTFTGLQLFRRNN
jgi:hypothetical protein